MRTVPCTTEIMEHIIQCHVTLYGSPTPFKEFISSYCFYTIKLWLGGTCNDFLLLYNRTYIYRIEQLHKVIMQYTHVLMCRDLMDGTLRGGHVAGN